MNMMIHLLVVNNKANIWLLKQENLTTFYLDDNRTRSVGKNWPLITFIISPTIICVHLSVVQCPSRKTVKRNKQFQYINMIQWNLSNSNLLVTGGQFIQVKLTKFSYFRTLLIWRPSFALQTNERFI